MIKVFTILLFFTLTFELHSQNYWLKQNSSTNKNIRTCFFTDTSNGWAAGDSGLIIHTSNGGKVWNIQNTGIDDGVVSLFFLNENKGYALAWELENTPPDFYGTRILSTTNGGNNWSNYMYPDSNVFLNSIIYLDSLNGHMVGSEGTLLFTTNSGSNWNKGKIDSGLILRFPVEKVKFINSYTGYAVGGAFDIAGVIWKTTNSGADWRTQIVGPEPLHDLHIYDSFNAICVGGDFEYGASTVHTTNQGSVWNYTELHVFGIANSIDFRTQNEGWCTLGIVDSFLVSTNGGNNWRLTATPNNTYIHSLLFIDSLHGWAVGDSGAILKFNSDLISVPEIETSIPESIELFQNYPNPFNPNTVIRFNIPQDVRRKMQDVTLIIYNSLGKAIKTLVNEKKSAGSYSVQFDGLNFSSGVYYYKLTAGDFTDAKKMILIK